MRGQRKNIIREKLLQLSSWPKEDDPNIERSFDVFRPHVQDKALEGFQVVPCGMTFAFSPHKDP
jgi:hypothetical protein